MEKSLNCFLKILFGAFTLLVIGCHRYESVPMKEFTSEEKMVLAEQLLNGTGYRYHYQGTVGEQMLIEEAKKYNPEHASVFREQGIPYLMRGMASKFYPYFQKMVQADSVEWQGYRGYYYLYLYRDYERALADFNDVDERTPNFVDYPQTISVDYMRAICYEKLNQPQKALEFIDKHLEKEQTTVGEGYIYAVAFICKGLAHEKLNQLDAAKNIYKRGIKIHPKNADLKYYYGKLLLKLGQKTEAAEVLAESRDQFKKEEHNTRPFSEEFYQIYLLDIEEAELSIDEEVSYN